MSFYAYIHCKPDGTPFYVGKGDETRVSFKKRYHNRHHMNVLNKYGEDKILVGKMECSTEDIAFDLERGLIKRLRKMGVGIVNLTEGGDGTKGAVRSPEARARMAAAKIGNQWNVGRKYSLATKIKKSRSRGGSAVECEKDGVVLRFPTIAEACKALGLDGGNVSNSLKRAASGVDSKVKGWRIRRVSE